MHPERRRALKRAWRERPPPAGVYRVRDTVTGEALFGRSPDVPAALNRHRFMLRAGVHPNAPLLAAWRLHGGDAFAFETLELLEGTDAPDCDLEGELAILEALWLDRLGPLDQVFNAGERPSSR